MIKTLPNWSHDELKEFLRTQHACTASRQWLAAAGYDLKAAVTNCTNADWFNWFTIRLWNKQLISDNTNRVAARINDNFLEAHDEFKQAYFNEELERNEFHTQTDLLNARIVTRFRELLLPLIEE